MNFGIVGCGRVAHRHAETISDLPDTTLVAVADVVEDRANYLAELHGADASVEYQEILRRDDIDVINICTPSGLHPEMAIDAMEAGKHVIVEKPMALTLDDADSMIGTSLRTERKLCVILQNRFNPPVRQLREAIDQGKLGKLYLGNATVRWFRPQEYYEDEWHGTANMDGGALMNQSIHHIDALQWMMGEVESVFCFADILAHRIETEDVGVASLRFRSGALGVVEGSTITFPENLEGSIAVFGEKGSVKVGGKGLDRIDLWRVDGELDREKEILTRQMIEPPTVRGHSHRLVIEDMIKAIEEDREPLTNGDEGRKSVALVLAMQKSAKLGVPIDMNGGNWRKVWKLETPSSIQMSSS